MPVVCVLLSTMVGWGKSKRGFGMSISWEWRLKLSMSRGDLVRSRVFLKLLFTKDRSSLTQGNEGSKKYWKIKKNTKNIHDNKNQYVWYTFKAILTDMISSNMNPFKTSLSFGILFTTAGNLTCDLITKNTWNSGISKAATHIYNHTSLKFNIYNTSGKETGNVFWSKSLRGG